MNIETATNNNRPSTNELMNNIKAVKLGGRVKSYGFGKKKATIRIGKQRNKALDSRWASSLAYQNP